MGGGWTPEDMKWQFVQNPQMARHDLSQEGAENVSLASNDSWKCLQACGFDSGVQLSSRGI